MARVIKISDLNEIEKFATVFHQDLYALNGTYELAAESYISSAEKATLKELKKQLKVFLALHENSSDKTIAKAWFKLGAHATRKHLHKFLKTVMLKL